MLHCSEFISSRLKQNTPIWLCDGTWCIWKATRTFYALCFLGHVHSENMDCIFTSVFSDDEMQVQKWWQNCPRHALGLDATNSYRYLYMEAVRALTGHLFGFPVIWVQIKKVLQFYSYSKGNKVLAKKELNRTQCQTTKTRSKFLRLPCNFSLFQFR